jgi:hypothetical protein
MRRASCAAAMFVLAAVATTPAYGDALLRKSTARRVSVQVTSETCRVVQWCKGYEVVPARRCRREDQRAVYCRMWFITASRNRCGGLVSVSRTRAGRIDRGVAVPLDCSGVH